MPQAYMPTVSSCGVLQASDYRGAEPVPGPSMEWGTRDTQGQLSADLQYQL